MSVKKKEKITPSPVTIVGEAAGEIVERFGYRPVVGKVWASLFMSPGMRDVTSLREELKISSGALSMALQELQDLGAVYRETVEGERRYFYRAEHDLWIVITSMYQKHWRIRFEDMEHTLSSAMSTLSALPDDNNTSHMIDRLRHMLGVVEFVSGVLEAAMARTRVELKAAQKWLSVSEKLGGEPLSRLRKAINTTMVERKKR